MTSPVNYIDPTGHKAEWLKYADIAAFYKNLAIVYDDKLQKIKPNSVRRIDPDSDYAKQIILYRTLINNCNDIYWEYKEKAANAKDVGVLKAQTGTIVKDVLENNAQNAEPLKILEFKEVVENEAK